MRSASRRRSRPAIAAAAVLAGTIAALAAATGPSRSPPAPAAAAALPPLVDPAFTPGPPRRLGSTRNVSHWAVLRHATSARAAPRAGAPAVTALGLKTPEGTQNVVAVLGRARIVAAGPGCTSRYRCCRTARRGGSPDGRSADTRPYARCSTSTSAGSARRSTATAGRSSGRRSPSACRDGRRREGRFYVRNKLTRYRSPSYGPVAFGTSARSPTATDWPAGGFVGIHGTDQPTLVPGRVSHGCVRMRNPDLLALTRHMPVGTPIRVH